MNFKKTISVAQIINIEETTFSINILLLLL